MAATLVIGTIGACFTFGLTEELMGNGLISVGDMTDDMLVAGLAGGSGHHAGQAR